VSEGDNPEGPYTLNGPMETDGWCIDMTVLQHNDNLYAIWSGWDEPGSDRQFLYIAPMSDPVTISGPRVQICCNDTYMWELTEPNENGKGLNEGPQILQRGGKTFLLYSCGASWWPTYKLGRLELVDDDPLQPSSWAKAPEPAFQSTALTTGVGHSSFVKAKGADDEWWHVYHVKNSPEKGWDRTVFIMPFKWTEYGYPNLSVPVGRGIPVSLPSGDETPTLKVGSYNIRSDSREEGRRFLSVNSEGTTVDLWEEAGDHQKWIVSPAKGLRGVVSIRCDAEVADDRKFLSTNNDGSVVDLWTGFGANQSWVIQGKAGSDGLFSIRLLANKAGPKAFLSANEDGSVVDLWTEVGENQLWKFEAC